MGFWPVVGLVFILVSSVVVAYEEGVDDGTPSVVDVDRADRETPTGEVRYDCSGEVCDVTVAVGEWGNYKTLAVQDVSGDVAETYYLHPGGESVTIEGVEKNEYDEVAVYVPV